METRLKEDLQALTCQGNRAILPRKQLKDYGGLKQVLLKAQGKYARNGFDFPFPAEVVINRLLGGEAIDWKKSTQFFATPPEMANFMVEQIVGFGDTGIELLEPEVGQGALLKAVLQSRPNLNITAIEKDEMNYEVTKDLYPDINLTHGDFLTHDFKGKKFDIILANPPFSRNQDIDHVMKMYDLLADAGQLLTIMSNSWTFGPHKKQVAFREWIEEVEAVVRENGQGAFKTSGTMVQSVLVEINK